MNNIAKKLGVTAGALMVLFQVSTAFAENTTGEILRLREGRASGRVSIQMSKANDPCPFQGWYAYEEASGSERVRTDLLIAAYAAGRRVTVNGTGQCDAFGVETIDYIDVE